MTAQEPEPRVEVTWRPAPERTADFEALLRLLFEQGEAVDDAGKVA